LGKIPKLSIDPEKYIQNKKNVVWVAKAPESSIRFLGFTRSCDTNGNCNRKFINEYVPTST
jgi:hypothetical protein